MQQNDQTNANEMNPTVQELQQQIAELKAEVEAQRTARTYQRPVSPFLPTTEARASSSATSEPWMITSRNNLRLEPPKHFDGINLQYFYVFKKKVIDWIFATLPVDDTNTQTAVIVASNRLEGLAYEWYAAGGPFENPNDLFNKMAIRFGITNQEDKALSQLEFHTSKPWAGDYSSWYSTFQPLIQHCRSVTS
jgi:hypothetical protein